MAKLAVSVVLIPPKNIQKLAIDINHSMEKTAVEDYVLDEKTCIPHITLLMGLVEEEQFPIVIERLNSLSNKFRALNLKIDRVHSKKREDGRIISGFEIGKTKELQELHEAVLEEMKNIFTYDGVSKEMFFTPPKLNEIPLFWVKGFAKTGVRENYRPHITLGIDETKEQVKPIEFKASELAFCQLGNYCTCRKVFSKNKLN